MMKLEQAKAYADQIVNQISIVTERILIAGSVRRKKPFINDIDIVAIPRGQKDIAWDAIARSLENIGFKKVKHGPQLMTYQQPKGAFTVDIYRATPQTWGILALIRTGSTEHNVKLCKLALKLGLELSAKNGVLNPAVAGKDGTSLVIASETEEEIFRALKLDYIQPENREVST